VDDSLCATAKINQALELRIAQSSPTMYFMLIALISILGSGLLGIIAVLIHYLLRQNAQRAQEHKEAMAAIAKATADLTALHLEAMTAIAKTAADLTAHTEALHREAMAAIAKATADLTALHLEAMTAIAQQNERNFKMHLEAMTAIAQQGERISALETTAGLRAAI